MPSGSRPGVIRIVGSIQAGSPIMRLGVSIPVRLLNIDADRHKRHRSLGCYTSSRLADTLAGRRLVTPPPHAMDGTPPIIQLGDYGCTFVATLAPQRAAAGRIVEVSPQGAYAQAASAQIHKYGHGTFCTFRVVVPKELAGVYA